MLQAIESSNAIRHERQMRAYEARARIARAEAHAAAFRSLGRAVSNLAGGLAGRIRRARLERATVRKLSALDDRMLRDIGLTRADVRDVSATLAARDAKRERVRAVARSTVARHAGRASEREWRRAA